MCIFCLGRSQSSLAPAFRCRESTTFDKMAHQRSRRSACHQVKSGLSAKIVTLRLARSGMWIMAILSWGRRVGNAIRVFGQRYAVLQCRRAIIRMVAVKVANLSVCQGLKAHGVNQHWVIRHVATRRQINILYDVVERNAARNLAIHLWS